MAVTVARGFNCKGVIVIESTFGADPGSGYTAVPLVSWDPGHSLDIVPNEAHQAGTAAGKLKPLPTTETNIVKAVYELDYHNSEELLRACVGAQTGTGVYGANAYVMDPPDDYAVSYTHVFSLGIKRWSYSGGVVHAFRIRGGSSQQKILLEIDWQFATCTPWSATALPTAAFTSIDYKVMFSTLVFRIADAASALAAGDALSITDFVLSYSNSLKVDFGSGSTGIMQPVRGDLRDVSLNITTPYFDDSDEINAIMVAAAFPSGTTGILQCDLIFTGLALTRIFTIQMPELYILNYPTVPVNGSGVLPFSVELVGHQNINNLTYMASVVDEVEFKLENAAAG